MSAFASLDLIEPLLRALNEAGYTAPTPIQAQAIPPLLEGDDVLGCAQTGTGKTAAFLLPMIQQLANDPWPGKSTIRGLVLTPTRELAAQIGENFEAYSRYVDLSHLVIFGGVNQRPQVQALRKGVDVLVATPGRLLDLQNQGYLNFEDVEFFVLDEADRMLDMGFIHDIRKVLALLPNERQNLLFSATMPDPIAKLAGGFMHDPVRVEVTPQSTTVERIEQQVMFVAKADKKRLLCHLLKDPTIESAIVFTRTKHGANRVVKDLHKAGIESAAIHGNKSQNARTRALDGFRSGELRVLVATDIASRGIDVDGVSHVFNYDLPNISESYVHRIGRTARAGRDGIAIAFCDETETQFLVDIEKLTGQPLEVVKAHSWHFEEAVPVARPEPSRAGGSRSRGGRGGGGGGGGARSGGSRGGRGGGGRGGERRSAESRSAESRGNDRSGERSGGERGADRGHHEHRDGQRRNGRSDDGQASHSPRRTPSRSGQGGGQGGGQSRPAGEGARPNRRRRRRGRGGQGGGGGRGGGGQS